MRRVLGLLAIALFPYLSLFAQSPAATVTGRVLDPSQAVIVDAKIEAINAGTSVRHSASTNSEGIYVIPNLPPGTYSLEVAKSGFKTIIKPDVVLHVQDVIAINFTLPVGSTAESVTVQAGAPMVNTQSAAVGTVVDRQFVGNIPLNARSLHSLITLVPGVVRSAGDGQFSVNGQRNNANYFSIDGVSANISVRADLADPAQHFAGTIPGRTVFGGTNNLISIDALEEFRIQTSTSAPESGRTPGGQVSLVSRSGTNEFHGVLFEYFRNDALDANDWFANRAGLPKPALRQNQFGGTLGGPVRIPGLYNGKNRTFFFVSYEGLRVRQPQTANTFVPALRLRQNAPPDVQLLLNAFPLPTGPEVVDPVLGPTGEAPLTAVFSDPISMSATSLRVDHVFSPRFTLFGRYNQAPSRQRSRSSFDPSQVFDTRDDTRTLTLGATFSLTPRLHNEFRANYSRVRAVSAGELDNFGGAVPFTLSQVLPPVLAPNQRGGFGVNLFLTSVFPSLSLFPGQTNLQQLNLANNVSLVAGRHLVKFGIDYRRLAPRNRPPDYFLGVFFCSEFEIFSSIPCFTTIQASDTTSPRFTNFSTFAQDTWSVGSRLTLTYGLRWDVNPAPTEADGKQPFVVRGLDDLATATVEPLPPGERLWKTRYSNVAPRVGVAYQLTQRQGWETMLRGGFGFFHDLGTGSAGGALLAEALGRNPFAILIGEPYPLAPSQATPPPPFQVPELLVAFDPNLKVPFTYQWNVSAEQVLGVDQSLSVSYVGAAGRRLLDRRTLFSPLPSAPTVGRMRLVGNGATSDYHALQIEFQRQLSRGLQVLSSYTWSHAIDNLSDELNEFDQPLRGDADFDVRHLFSAAITYDIPSPVQRSVGKAVLGNWAIDTIIRAQSAYPFTPAADFIFLPDGTALSQRPDLVSGVPLYLDDASAPGGRRVNPAAFQTPPAGQQGNAGRNILRGFSIHQVDFAIRRAFPLTERVKLLFRAEAFNVFNHPNFALPERQLSSPLFGEATSMLNRGFGGLSVLSPIYEIGGPRSMQFALRLQF